MGLFKRKTPEEKAELKAQAEAQAKAKEEARTYRVRKLNIDRNNPDVDYQEIRLSMDELHRIYLDLYKAGTYRGVYGEEPKDQSNPSRYPVYEVQKLFDYAKGCRYAMNWLMENAIERGIAYYDKKGTFKFKEIEEDENKTG